MRGLLRAFVLIVAAGIGGCIVTDEIEFQSAVNHPATVISTSPLTDTLNYATEKEVREFTVTIWDPDADDIDTYDGRISLIESVNSSETNRDTVSCNTPVIADNADYSTGVVITFKCEITLDPTSSATEVLLVEVELSDKGYLPGDELQSGTNAIRVNWTFELLPQGAV